MDSSNIFLDLNENLDEALIAEAEEMLNKKEKEPKFPQSKREIEEIGGYINIMENNNFDINNNQYNNFEDINNNQKTTFEDLIGLIHPNIVEILKDHQKEGICFLWDRIVKASQAEKGCILAHSMGLGKTLQLVVFIDLLFQFTEGKFKKILIVAPKSTLLQWENEFKKWNYSIQTYIIMDSSKNEKKDMIYEWSFSGGVLIISYNLFALLTGTIKKNSNTQEDIDFCKNILFNSPDLLICDEGHKVKSETNCFTVALKSVATRNRVLLTGTPVQNNFSELFSMLDFIQPHIWNKEQFFELYEKPIRIGSRKNSTHLEVQKMKAASYKLSVNILDKLIHRRGPNLLLKDLPPKQEYIIKVRFSPFQRELYSLCLEEKRLSGNSFKDNLLSFLDTLRKICNHADLLAQGYTETSKSEIKTEEQEESEEEFQEDEWTELNAESNMNRRKIQYSFLKDFFRKVNYNFGNSAEHSSKMNVLMYWIQGCVFLNEKMLIFSQWTSTLDVIESTLKKFHFYDSEEESISFEKNINYLRLDGQSTRRQELMDQFNDPNSPYLIFLISTTAGGLGLNLTAATRILIYDVMFNPVNDFQACCRSYRYGQTKPVYIYRLVQSDSVEEVIWNRCCAKTWISQRVIDTKSIKRMLTIDDFNFFSSSNGNSNTSIDWERLCEIDPIMKWLNFRNIEDKLGIESIIDHDSLFQEDENDKLSLNEQLQIHPELDRALLESFTSGKEIEFEQKNADLSHPFAEGFCTGISLEMQMEKLHRSEFKSNELDGTIPLSSQHQKPLNTKFLERIKEQKKEQEERKKLELEQKRSQYPSYVLKQMKEEKEKKEQEEEERRKQIANERASRLSEIQSLILNQRDPRLRKTYSSPTFSSPVKVEKRKCDQISKTKSFPLQTSSVKKMKTSPDPSVPSKDEIKQVSTKLPVFKTSPKDQSPGRVLFENLNEPSKMKYKIAGYISAKLKSIMVNDYSGSGPTKEDCMNINRKVTHKIVEENLPSSKDLDQETKKRIKRALNEELAKFKITIRE